MTKFSCVEDLLAEFYNQTLFDIAILQDQDRAAIHGFYNTLDLGNQLTANQGGFLLKILAKYKTFANSLGIDYGTLIDIPIWKTTFRKLDLTRKIFVEQSEEGEITVCLKFPYALKDTFEKEFHTENTPYSSNTWDSDRKLRVLNVYKYNIIQLEEFCRKHDFELDDTFLTLVDTVAEIWNQQDQIIPCAYITAGELVLCNATEDAEIFYQKHKQDDINQNLFLAKSMGYPMRFDRPIETKLEMISASTSRSFWIKSNRDFFDLYQQINGVVCVLVDRNTQDSIEWLQKFVESADIAGIPRSDIKVCFRDPTEKKSQLNAWVKDNNLGGKVQEGKILIFFHKPPKWLFKDNIDVKIVVTNSYTPINEPTSSVWLDTHPCVCYLGEIKPTLTRKQKIVSL